MSSYTFAPDVEKESAEWHSRRTGLITATDIGRLANGGPAAWAAVKAEKNGARGFTGNRYTEWGNEREPIIASHVEFLHDVPANARLIIAENGHHAATPDGFAPGVNGEYKTTVKDWEPVIDAIPANYRDQVYWAQFVTDAGETVFAWEPHENFVPGPIRTLIVPRDDARIARLVEIGAEFDEYLATDQDADEFTDLIALAAEKKRILAAASDEYAAVEQQIRDRVGDRTALSAKSPFGSISYYTPKPAERFDSAAFKAADPGTYAQYIKTTQPGKPTLRITVKG